VPGLAVSATLHACTPTAGQQRPAGGGLGPLTSGSRSAPAWHLPARLASAPALPPSLPGPAAGAPYWQPGSSAMWVGAPGARPSGRPGRPSVPAWHPGPLRLALLAWQWAPPPPPPPQAPACQPLVRPLRPRRDAVRVCVPGGPGLRSQPCSPAWQPPARRPCTPPPLGSRWRRPLLPMQRRRAGGPSPIALLPHLSALSRAPGRVARCCCSCCCPAGPACSQIAVAAPRPRQPPGGCLRGLPPFACCIHVRPLTAAAPGTLTAARPLF
jgi:hypothetical protein